MALKTMQVIQLASGRLVTINASDFNNDLYALPGAPAAQPAPAPPPPPAGGMDELLAALTPKEPPAEPVEPEDPAPRRRRGR